MTCGHFRARGMTFKDVVRPCEPTACRVRICVNSSESFGKVGVVERGPVGDEVSLPPPVLRCLRLMRAAIRCAHLGFSYPTHFRDLRKQPVTIPAQIRNP